MAGTEWIEHPSSVLETEIMPLYDIPKLVTGGGFEPPMFTTWVRVLQTRVFDQLDKTLPLNHLQNLLSPSLHLNLKWSWEQELHLRCFQMMAALQAAVFATRRHLMFKILVGATGLEPASHKLKVCCKTTLLRSNKWSGRQDSNLQRSFLTLD